MKKMACSIDILLADDHPIFRHGLRALLEAEPDFRIVGEAADGSEVVDLVRRLRPAVLLLDVAMPHVGGLEALRELVSEPLPSGDLPRIVLLTVGIEKRQIVEALQLGAHGIVLKDAAAQLLIQALRTVVSGQYWVGREAVADLIQYLRRIAPASVSGQEETRVLTSREKEIVSSIVAGLTNREIAEKLSISEDTVKHHLSRIFDKVGVSHRLELAMFAINHGLVQVE